MGLSSQDLPHCEVTIRELLCWVALVAPSLVATHAAPAPPSTVPLLALLQSAQHVYVKRFRKRAARDLVMSAVASALKMEAPTLSTGSSAPPAPITWDIQATDTTCTLTINTFSLAVDYPVPLDPAALHAHLLAHPQPAVKAAALRLPAALVLTAARCHASVCKLLLSKQFIEAHGVYPISESWLCRWLEAAASGEVNTRNQDEDAEDAMLRCGYVLYSAPLRHRSARHTVAILFRVEAATTMAAAGSAASPACLPVALTPGVLRVWSDVLPALQTQDPLMITGADGVGKVAALRALGTVLQMQLHSFQLTPGGWKSCAVSCAVEVVCGGRPGLKVNSGVSSFGVVSGNGGHHAS